MRIAIEHFTKRFGDVTVIENMNLEVRDGEMLALLGPSGCGKSTTLFAVCGIHAVDEGRILFGDEDVTRRSPQERNVGVVFQSFALYPHMTVYENVAFPLEIKSVPSAEIRQRVTDMTEMLEIGQLLDRLPGNLSGGQQQRVALARALVRKPSVLLLDEPLANLDARLRLEMRAEIRRLQLETGITAVLVTHDQVEAMSMCDRIAIMDGGTIHQIAAPKAMYDEPASAFVAGFLGNPPIAFTAGTVRGGKLALEAQGTGDGTAAPAMIDMPTAHAALSEGAEVQVGVRPEFLHPAESGSIRGQVSFVETQGREVLYDVTLPGGVVLRSIQPARDDITLGDELNWHVEADRLLVFDRDGGRL